MKNLSFKNHLISEMALHDYKTIGDFSKRQSFHDKRDRMIIQHPKAIERTRKKFGATNFDFDFYFVNTKEAKNYTEVGVVKPAWVKDNLGDEVYKAIEPNIGQNHIQIIFTNNSGAERKNMTAWMMAHRIGHALMRENNVHGSGYYYHQAGDFLVRSLSEILQHYGIQNFPKSEKQLTSYRENNRPSQLTLMHFFYEIATFRSARDRNIRDWFEVLNELVAQYLTTGKVKFNKAPASFGGATGGSFGRKRMYGLRNKNVEEVNGEIESFARDMEYHIDSMFGAVINDIFVM